MALRRKAAPEEVVVATPEPEDSQESIRLRMAQREYDLQQSVAAKAMRFDVTKASISAAAAISANPAQIAHIAVQIADAVIAELAKEKV